ncbi:MAG: hypothetical protein R3246_07035 [Acidimicrobiia bacterium]|nr:hypothetical protein [Acidimicrobiia bacterium]
MAQTSEAHNHYRTLGIRMDAPTWEIEEAAARLIIQAAGRKDYFLVDELEQARHWLLDPVLRAFHDEKIAASRSSA